MGQPSETPAAPFPIRGTEGANILGPTNPAREAQDPFTLAPPSTTAPSRT